MSSQGDPDELNSSHETSVKKNNVRRISECNVKIRKNKSIKRLETEPTMQKRPRVQIKIASQSDSTINSEDLVNKTPTPKKVITKLKEHKENDGEFKRRRGLEWETEAYRKLVNYIVENSLIKDNKIRSLTLDQLKELAIFIYPIWGQRSQYRHNIVSFLQRYEEVLIEDCKDYKESSLVAPLLREWISYKAQLVKALISCGDVIDLHKFVNDKQYPVSWEAKSRVIDLMVECPDLHKLNNVLMNNREEVAKNLEEALESSRSLSKSTTMSTTSVSTSTSPAQVQKEQIIGKRTSANQVNAANVEEIKKKISIGYQEGLEVQHINNKGRGIVTTTNFSKVLQNSLLPHAHIEATEVSKDDFIAQNICIQEENVSFESTAGFTGFSSEELDKSTANSLEFIRSLRKLITTIFVEETKKNVYDLFLYENIDSDIYGDALKLFKNLILLHVVTKNHYGSDLQLFFEMEKKDITFNLKTEVLQVLFKDVRKVQYDYLNMIIPYRIEIMNKSAEISKILNNAKVDLCSEMRDCFDVPAICRKLTAVLQNLLMDQEIEETEVSNEDPESRNSSDCQVTLPFTDEEIRDIVGD